MLRLNRLGIYGLSFCTQLIERRDTKPKHRHSRRHKFVSRVDTIYFKQQRAQCVQMNATIANHNSACEHNNQWVFGCRAKLAKSETKHRMEAHRAIPSTPLPSRWRKEALIKSSMRIHSLSGLEVILGTMAAAAIISTGRGLSGRKVLSASAQPVLMFKGTRLITCYIPQSDYYILALLIMPAYRRYVN